MDPGIITQSMRARIRAKHYTLYHRLFAAIIHHAISFSLNVYSMRPCSYILNTTNLVDNYAQNTIMHLFSRQCQMWIALLLEVFHNSEIKGTSRNKENNVHSFMKHPLCMLFQQKGIDELGLLISCTGAQSAPPTVNHIIPNFCCGTCSPPFTYTHYLVHNGTYKPRPHSYFFTVVPKGFITLVLSKSPQGW